uniref:SFRICE_005071 n=1 Tax=Spodoptera frugiperda TaxID=7108 RepID=A0A2H1VSJ7_SPOFR
MEEMGADEFTCYVSRCVTAKYRFRTRNVIEPELVRKKFRMFNYFDPDTKPLTDEIEDNCLDDHYFKYETNETSCDYNKFELCANVNALMAMEVTCCHPMKTFVDTNNQCLVELETDEFTCAVSKCATGKYNFTTRDNIDLKKVKHVLQNISDSDPETTPLVEEIKKNCFDDRYLRYVTSDPCCDNMKYEVCAYVSCLMGCQKFYTHPHRCRRLAINVAICKPVLQKYLAYINGESTCSTQ